MAGCEFIQGGVHIFVDRNFSISKGGNVKRKTR